MLKTLLMILIILTGGKNLTWCKAKESGTGYNQNNTGSIRKWR